MESFIKEPIYWFGVLGGFVISFLISELKQRLDFNKKRELFYQGEQRVDKMLSVMIAGEKLDLEEYYADRKNKKIQEPLGYLVWRDLAFWLTRVYDDGKYSFSPIDQFWKLAEIIFGNSCAYIKLKALDEIINRSTAYLIRTRYGNKENEEIKTKKLYAMVIQIVESYDSNVYERARTE